MSRHRVQIASLAAACCQARGLDTNQRGKVLIRFDSRGSNGDAEQQGCILAAWHRHRRFHPQPASGQTAAPSLSRSWAARRQYSAAIDQLSHTASVVETGLPQRLQLDQTTKGVVCKLAKKATLGTINLHRTPPAPPKAVLGFLLPSLQDQQLKIESHGSGSQQPR